MRTLQIAFSKAPPEHAAHVATVLADPITRAMISEAIGLCQLTLCQLGVPEIDTPETAAAFVQSYRQLVQERELLVQLLDVPEWWRNQRPLVPNED